MIIYRKVYIVLNGLYIMKKRLICPNKNKLIELYVNGMNRTELSKEFNVSTIVITKWLTIINDNLKGIEKAEIIHRYEVKEYRNTEKGKSVNKKSSKKYSQSDNGKERIKKYNQSDKGKERIKKYSQSDKGKITISKTQAKRNRNMGFIPLNNPQPNYDGHHINKEYIIYIPHDTHNSIYHNHNKPYTLIIINKIAWEYLYLKPNNINEDNLKKYKHI